MAEAERELMANANLQAAKAAKNDEFYTQWGDIEREMNAYLEYDPDVFRGKVVLLPCDDPEWSNFAKFFALHFTLDDHEPGKVAIYSTRAENHVDLVAACCQLR